MPRPSLTNLLGFLRGLAGTEQAVAATDRDLLQRFAATREESAFEALVLRHGNLVWDVCRNVLQDTSDAEDAFQVTFLVLARKAASIRKQEALGAWLYGVAYRVALKTRAASAQRRKKERQAAEMPRPQPKPEPLSREDRATVHEELQQIPEKYRTALLLCHLQGQTCEEAARELHCQPGTIKSRLARGRELLRTRLVRRGLTLSAGGVAGALAADVAAAAPPALVKRTVQAAILFVTGRAAEAIPENLLALTAAVLRGLTTPRAWLLAGATVCGLVVFGAVALAHLQAPPPPPPAIERLPEKEEVRRPQPQAPRPASLKQPDRNAAFKLTRLVLGTRRFWQADRPTNFAFSPDGKFVLCGGSVPAPVLRADTGKIFRFLAGPEGHVAFAPDGSLVAAGDGAVVALWDTGGLSSKQTAWKQIRQWGRTRPTVNLPYGSHPADRPGFLTFSQDSSLLAWADPDGSARLRKIKGQEEPSRLGGKQGKLWAGAFSPDSKTLATAGEDGSICLWEVATGAQRQRLTGHPGRVRALAFSPNGQILASAGSTGALFLWDLSGGGKRRALLGHRGEVLAVVFAPDGKTVVSSGADRTVRFWDIATAREKKRLPNYHGRALWLAWTPDGKSLATGDGHIRLWDPQTGAEVRPVKGSQNRVTAIAVAADGRSVATSDGSDTIRVWDRATGEELGRLRSPHGSVLSLAFAQGDKTLLSAGDSKVISAWDMSTGEEIRQYRHHDTGPLLLAVAPDGRKAASADRTTIRVWQVDTGQVLSRIDVHESGGLRCVAFAPDGNTLGAGGQDGIVRLWNVPATQAPRKLPAQGGPIVALAFAPDGRTLLTGADKVRLWDLGTGRPLSTFINAMPPLAFAPDGTTAATASQGDFNIQLYDARSGVCLRSPVEHRAALSALCFTPDGKGLVSASADTTAAIWYDRELSRPARLAPAELQRLWKDFLGDSIPRKLQAVWFLGAAREQTTALLREHLKPVVPGSPELDALLKESVSTKEAVRREARRRLAEYGALLQPALIHLIAHHPSPELRRRAEELLGKPGKRPPLQQGLQVAYYLQLMTTIATDDIREILEKLEREEPRTWVSQQVRGCLVNMDRRASRP